MRVPVNAAQGECVAPRSRGDWDSLLLAACIEAGVDTLYSEDLGAGTTYDTVLKVNPFA